MSRKKIQERLGSSKAFLMAICNLSHIALGGTCMNQPNCTLDNGPTEITNLVWHIGKGRRAACRMRAIVDEMRSFSLALKDFCCKGRKIGPKMHCTSGQPHWQLESHVGTACDGQQPGYGKIELCLPRWKKPSKASVTVGAAQDLSSTKLR